MKIDILFLIKMLDAKTTTANNIMHFSDPRMSIATYTLIGLLSNKIDDANLIIHSAMGKFL